MNKIYKLRYLPLFYSDLEQAVMYISNVLRNPQSAVKLIDDTEKEVRRFIYNRRNIDSMLF